MLFTQDVYSESNGNPLHREVLVRIANGKDGVTEAGRYLPLIDNHADAEALDKLVIENLLLHLKHEKVRIPYVVNLSLASITSPVFGDWLRKSLETATYAASRIQFEISEAIAMATMDSTKHLATELSTAGYQIGIDHFGRNFHPFGYLRTLNPCHIKIDGYYTRDIASDRDKQFFIKGLKDTVHSIGIRIIAQSIESNGEYDALLAVGLDGYQGYYLGKPKLLGT